MKLKFNNIVAVGLISILVGCTDGFKELNTNPNQSSTMDAGALFNQAVFQSMSLFGGSFSRTVCGNFAQYINAGGGEAQRYGDLTTTNDNYWSQLYVDCIQPTNNIIQLYGTDSLYNNRVNIARILQDYCYSQGVAIWGGIPMKGALKGTSAVPYDTEDSIYAHLMYDLRASVRKLNINGDKYPAQSDPIYASDISKWKKFGNSLLLRLCVRLSDCAQGALLDSIKLYTAEFQTDPNKLIASNSEIAAPRFGLTSTTWSDFYDYAVYGANLLTLANSLLINEIFIINTNPYKDPRLAVWVQKATTNTSKNSGYFGKANAAAIKPWFMPTGGAASPQAGKVLTDFSKVGTEFLRADAQFTFMSYSEVCFLLAELDLKKWNGKSDADAQTAYLAGIDASMLRLGVDGSAYKLKNGVKWGTKTINTPLDTLGRGADFMDWMKICSSFMYASTTDSLKLKQIVWQEWLSLYPNSLDAWTLHRRTQLLELTPHFNPANTAITNNQLYAFIPERISYPTNEYQTNAIEVQSAASRLIGGVDNQATGLWFTKPPKKTFFGYPNGFPQR